MTTSTLLSKDQGAPDLWWPYGPAVGRYTMKSTGDLVQMLMRDSRGAATPLHVHHHTDETYYVIEGEVTAFVDGERIDAKAGDFLFLPRGVPHCWIVTSERIEAFVTCNGPGLDDFFSEVAVPVGDGDKPDPTMPDNAHFAERMMAHGIELLGPPPSA
jgi:mannose-6-phosphate isomerase-like protein (cupin superfamily)